MKIAFYCRADGQSFGFILPDDADKLREFFAEHQDKPALMDFQAQALSLIHISEPTRRS